MNFGMVARVIGSLLLLEAAILTIPLGVSIYFQEQAGIWGLALSMGIAAFVGVVLVSLRGTSSRLKNREAILIVTLGWFFTSLFAALPFIFSGSLTSTADAFFEAVSGLTTTGATVISDVEVLPKGILFWRSFLHWVGGMGILVLTLAILPSLGVGGVQIFRMESSGPTPSKFTPRIAATTKILYTIYLSLTAVQVLVYRFAGLDLLDSFIVAFGSVGTGGLSPYNDGFVRHSGNVLLLVSVGVAMIISGVNFSLYYDLGKRRFRQVLRDSELRLFLAIIATSVLLLTWNLLGNVYDTLAESAKMAFFHVSSVITTTGYAAADYDLWPAFGKGILFVLMFVGGSAGSTAGGVKVIRLLVAGKLVRRELDRLLHPKAASLITINGRVLPAEEVKGAVSFCLLYFFVFILGSLLISLDNIDLFSAVSATAAALGNIGPGFGAVGPMQTYAFFSPFSKILLSFFMLLGRLEFFAFLILFSPRFWRE